MIKDFTGLAKAINAFREANQNNKFDYQTLQARLNEFGFRKNVVSALIKKGYITKEPIGNKQFQYGFKAEPINIYQLETVFKELRSKKPKGIDTSVAISHLQSAGYKIQKCIGFDEEKFSKDHPELYQQYLKYEIL